jgi:predicted acylesterase/phospholipase RssA
MESKEKKKEKGEDSYTDAKKPSIKHLVIPGGGPNGIKALGALQELQENGFWHIDNIQSIYATSSGSIIAVLLAMKFDWPSIVDYILLRPWHETFPITAQHLLDSFQKKGLYDKDVFEIFYRPFFDARDLPLHMSMKEFYELFSIELHFFSLELNEFKVHDISYLTYPDLPVVEAVHMSSAIPMIFTPVILGEHCFIDGGIVTNYPLRYCLERFPDAKGNILGFHNVYQSKKDHFIQEENNMMDMMVYFFSMLIHQANQEVSKPSIDYEVIYPMKNMNLTMLQESLFSSDVRKSYWKEGKQVGEEFLHNIFKNKS